MHQIIAFVVVDRMIAIVASQKIALSGFGRKWHEKVDTKTR
jgi:hypothetical protein